MRSALLFLMATIVASTEVLAGGQTGDGLCRLPGDGVNGEPLRYRTLMDGTIKDLNTGLTWEVKNNGGGIHGVNRTFTWSDSGTEPDGTAFTVFLDTLNNKCDQGETISCTKNSDCQGVGNGKCGYAGHQDWRMPNVKELQSIVDYGRFQPAIDPTFGPTRPNSAAGPNYWSSTTYAQDEDFALFVNFDTGFASSDGKVFTFFGVGLPVRAVRDGRCQQ
jgi:Protein of unknown function (DUF1566)